MTDKGLATATWSREMAEIPAPQQPHLHIISASAFLTDSKVSNFGGWGEAVHGGKRKAVRNQPNTLGTSPHKRSHSNMYFLQIIEKLSEESILAMMPGLST